MTCEPASNRDVRISSSRDLSHQVKAFARQRLHLSGIDDERLAHVFRQWTNAIVAIIKSRYATTTVILHCEMQVVLHVLLAIPSSTCKRHNSSCQSQRKTLQPEWQPSGQ